MRISRRSGVYDFNSVGHQVLPQLGDFVNAVPVRLRRSSGTPVGSYIRRANCFRTEVVVGRFLASMRPSVLRTSGEILDNPQHSGGLARSRRIDCIPIVPFANHGPCKSLLRSSVCQQTGAGRIKILSREILEDFRARLDAVTRQTAQECHRPYRLSTAQSGQKNSKTYTGIPPGESCSLRERRGYSN